MSSTLLGWQAWCREERLNYVHLEDLKAELEACGLTPDAFSHLLVVRDPLAREVPRLSCLHRRSIFAQSFQVQRSNPFCSFPFRHIASSHLSTWSNFCNNISLSAIAKEDWHVMRQEHT